MATLFAGIDIGSWQTKAALVDEEGKIVGLGLCRSGTDFQGAAKKSLAIALLAGKVKREALAYTVATNLGRENVSFAQGTKTEISCQGKGCYHFFPEEITIVDIGGQDSKIIKLNDRGLRTAFKMNRKCAAGTGAFLEEMARRLEIPLENLDALARGAEKNLELGSFCTVFTATEVLEKIRQGERIPNIVRGLFLSVIKRVIEMDTLPHGTLWTGGVVAHNPFLVALAEERVGAKFRIPPHPQFTCAIGAALYARERGGE